LHLNPSIPRANLSRVRLSPWPILLCALVTGCTVLPDKPTGAPSTAFSDTANTTLGKLAPHLNQTSQPATPNSAICTLDRGQEAFLSRIALIDLAERSVDIQTYAWTADRTGKLLAYRLLRAAERGVRVRILLDDIGTFGRDFNIALFAAYPNIQVRLYNPFRFRLSWRIGRPIELLFDLDRLDHRMHNKTFVVDNQAAVVGGRNIGDEYFGVNPKYDYRDFDLMVFGHGATQVSDCFDAYWADSRVYPVHDVAPREFKKQDLQETRRKLDTTVQAQLPAFPYRLPDSRDQALAYVTDEMHAAVLAPTQMLFDDPRKGDIHTAQPSHIRQVLTQTPPASEAILMNPYFIPQERFTEALIDQEKRGVRVRILTNSLASTDVVAVHSAYGKRRPDLLKGGVSLFEVRPDAEARSRFISPECPNATLSLHGKVMVLDRRRVFVGSMNLDPRSHHLNTEDGMLVDSPQLAEQVAQCLQVGFDPPNAWRLEYQDDRVLWLTTRNGTQVLKTNDPDASCGRKIQCDILSLLPIEGEL
jgi:putative cardiolipin synthase